MRPVSDKFLDTLHGSHLAVFRARVQDTFVITTNPGGTEIPIIAGDVKYVADAEVRSTLTLTTSASWPLTSSDTLVPYGHYVYVERGIAYGNAQREWVGLGYFRIDTIEQDDTPDGPVVITGSDRNAGLRDARFLAPQQFASTLTNGQVVDSLITGVYFFASIIEWDDTAVRDDTIGRTIIAEDDRLGTLRDLLTSLGKIGYWDHRGIFVIKTPPDVTGTAQWEIAAGENGVLVQMSRALTREGVFNAVVATGEAGDTTAPVRAVATDNNPTSPTYYSGPFGPVPRFYSSPFITTTAQAQSAAQALLKQNLGLPYQVNLGSIANPALEPYDVIDVKYPRNSRNRSLRTERHVIDEITIPLTPDKPVTLNTRQQQTVLIGEAS